MEAARRKARAGFFMQKKAEVITRESRGRQESVPKWKRASLVR